MEFIKRHEGHAAATTTAMDMAMALGMTMALSMTMDMPSETSGAMDMSGSMDMSGMNMFLTTAYKNYPVLFETLKAANGGQAFGIFFLIFFVSFLTRGFEFLKNYLEQRVWNNPNYLIPQQTTIIENCECDDDFDKSNTESAIESKTPTGTHTRLSLANVLVRDVIRLILVFVVELFSYAMMLVTMTFSLVYFFAVVTGMTFGRFFFERLSDTMGIRPGSNNFQGHH